MKQAGFRELEHTADWELQVWAPDLPDLFEQAALGMISLSGIELAEAPRMERDIVLEAQDFESMLVSFLQELLFWGERDELAFDRFNLTITRHLLNGQLSGAKIIRRDKEIKAVTYHNLQLEQTPAGFQVNLVFDV